MPCAVNRMFKLRPTTGSNFNNSGIFRAKFFINLLKAWFGNAATKENDYCFGLLPIRNTTQNDSIYVQFEKAIEGKMKCIYFAGQNPMVSNPNLGNVHRGLRKLDTVIVEDLYINETAAFWERPDSPEGHPIKPEDIQTEVIFLPACSYLALEKIRELYSDSTDPKDQIIKLLT